MAATFHTLSTAFLCQGGSCAFPAITASGVHTTQAMVRDRVAFRFLAPGGCASGAAENVACSGATHETAALGVEESAVEQADVIVSQNVCVLEVSEEDHLDDWLAALKGQNAGSCKLGEMCCMWST